MPIELIGNVLIAGVLSGLVYGLMALGLSVIFGVVRVVNFAHGEMMTAAMFAAVVLFYAWGIDPFLAVIPVSVVFFVLGYLLQRGIINPFITRPEHSQFMLLVAVAIIMVNGLLIAFGPNARNVQVDYQLDSFEIGPMLVDAARLYAAAAALVFSAAVFAFFRFTMTGKAIRACADNYIGAKVVGLDIRHLYALTFGLGSACVAAAGCMMVLLVDVTPLLGPAYTLMAFVIVIVGGMGSMPGALLGGVLIGVSEAAAGLFITPSAKSMVSFALLIVVLLFRPQGLLGEEAVNGLLSQVNARSRVVLLLLALLLLALPWIANNYVLSVAVLILYFAYTGQAWNVMMGFCGQLSLGHSLYVGIGAYTSAALFVHFGIGPWGGALAAIALSMLVGAIIGFLAFRFGIGGVYFALLTIAFAEFARIGFDHWQWLGASGGFFLPVKQREVNDLLNLRGSPVMFYYVMLALTTAALVFCTWLLRTRMGYYWLAIREDQDAAQALGINTFRCKLIAILISSGMTSLAGVFFAFYYNNLFPEQVFNMGRSIEIILGPIIGGIGTLFGPILGAALLAILADGTTELIGMAGIELPGIKQVFYGLCLLLVTMFLPNGVWPALARRFGLAGPDSAAGRTTPVEEGIAAERKDG